jgi:1,2-diacylglycerol 3-alpha-glucosyltransferase
MRILITTDLYTTETNGVVTSVRNLSNELIKKGHDVRILTFSENTHSRKEGNVYYIKSMPFAVYPNVRMPFKTTNRHRLIKEIIEWDPEIVHSQCEFFSLPFANRISKITRAPIVHTYHTLYEQYVTYLFPSRRVGHFVVRTASKGLLKNVDTVIAPTRKVEDALHGYGMENQIKVVPSGINLEQHKKRITEEERSEKRRALGIADDDIVLINLGRLGTEKNLDELLDFFAKARKHREHLRFLIVGDGPAREDLQKRAKELGVENDVIFTGMVKPTEVQEYYQLGDVFVSASTSETQGLTYIEAEANGLPLLCRQDECLRDVIAQGENGYEYTSEEEFLESIDRIASDPEWRTEAGKRSEEIAASFDKETFASSIEAIYKSLLEHNEIEDFELIGASNN